MQQSLMKIVIPTIVLPLTKPETNYELNASNNNDVNLHRP
jgi:hypothetical protein